MATTWPTATSSNLLRARSPAGHPGILSRPYRRLHAAGLALVLVASPMPALALSQIPSEEGTVPSWEGIISVPLPPLPSPEGTTSEPQGTDPIKQGDETFEVEDGRPGLNEIPPPEPLDPDATDRPAGEQLPARPPEAPLLPIRYGDDGLDQPVRDLRARLIEIARAGEIEALRPYIETGSEPTALAVQPIETDPIEFLKEASGDGEGVEILAILLEVLLAGHVLVNEGGDEAIHVWPYFTQVPLDRLTRPQLVELFEIVTAGDYESMLDNGAYDFYRVGISPEGRLEFFLAGD